jgi:hypothetical protein
MAEKVDALMAETLKALARATEADRKTAEMATTAAEKATQAVKDARAAQDADAQEAIRKMASLESGQAVTVMQKMQVWAGARSSCNGAECGFGCGAGCATVCIATEGLGTAIAAAGGTTGGSGASIALSRVLEV